MSIGKHVIRSGLVSILTETISTLTNLPTLIRFGIDNKYLYQIGDQAYLRANHQIDGNAIVRYVLNRHY